MVRCELGTIYSIRTKKKKNKEIWKDMHNITSEESQRIKISKYTKMNPNAFEIKLSFIFKKLTS
jgi:hypothetical protein